MLFAAFPEFMEVVRASILLLCLLTFRNLLFLLLQGNFALGNAELGFSSSNKVSIFSSLTAEVAAGGETRPVAKALCPPSKPLSGQNIFNT